jgi:hypothetical protein
MRVSEFTTADNGATLDPASEQIVFEMAQPGGHNNGGHLLFGPDGYLYLAWVTAATTTATRRSRQWPAHQQPVGQDPAHRRQRHDGSRRYKIPADNPFAANALCNLDGTGSADCPKSFAWGFRNPWRWTFDRAAASCGWATWVRTRARSGSRREGWQLWLALHGRHAPTSLSAARRAPVDRAGGRIRTPHRPGRDRWLRVPRHGDSDLTGQYLFADYSSQLIWHIATDTHPRSS